jgi:probable rRNA maturation factor
MISCENKTTISYPEALLEEIALYLSDKEVELILTDDAEIRAVNALQRGKNSATDVLSFPLEAMEGFPLGSIMISVDMAAKVAQDLGHQVEDEIALLFIHGMLHLLGYDHEVDSGQMREKEQAIVAHFKLPKSLIVRSD